EGGVEEGAGTAAEFGELRRTRWGAFTWLRQSLLPTTLIGLPRSTNAPIVILSEARNLFFCAPGQSQLRFGKFFLCTPSGRRSFAVSACTRIEMDWNSEDVAKVIERALAEDVGAGDATVAATIPAGATGQAHIVAKQELVCAGLPLAEMVFGRLDPHMRMESRAADGQLVKNGEDVLRLSGKVAAILTGERRAVNFLGHLSGIATLTRRFVEQVHGTQARIRDTRKTTPGLRQLEKYAVKMGGGANHRFGLYDAILLKENHIALTGGV